MTKRITVPELDKLLGQRIPVLDDGFVMLVDYMGNDSSVVQAARVSYGEGTKKVHEDRGLIRYLMRHRHTTPFEMCELKICVRVPMDCWRQWIRHRTASVNEYSTRYSVAINSSQTTKPDEWRRQAEGNRQGSGDMLSIKEGQELSLDEENFQALARNIYTGRLNKGVAREQARKDLPLSTYTEAYWKTNLHNLLHFLSLRIDEHSQWEIRQYANAIADNFVNPWVPMTWQAFEDYRVGSTTLTDNERWIVKCLVKGRKDMAIEKLSMMGWLNGYDEGKLKKNRERDEFKKKLEALGIIAPWEN